MRVDWYGQAAFHLTGRDGTVFIDPIGEIPSLAARGITFDYPAPDGVSADLLLVTHEHGDHNGVDSIGGDPAILRSTAGRLESPFGEVVAIASEHDEAAGTQRGPNTIFVLASTACASRTSATSASARCATSRRRRSERST